MYETIFQKILEQLFYTFYSKNRVKNRKNTLLVFTIFLKLVL